MVYGITRERIQTYVPEHFRDTALRLFDLGYEVNFRKQYPNPKKSRMTAREILEAENRDFVQIQLTRVHVLNKGLVTLLAGSVRDYSGNQLKKFPLDGMDQLWRFAENGGRCSCGLNPLSEGSAAKLSGGRGTSCPDWSGLFHIARQG